MAGSFFGADVDQLRQLSRSLAQNAEQIQAITTRLSPRIDSTGWRGPDADRFRGGWNEELAPSLRAATRALEDASGLAETNARQQEQASGVGGGSGSGNFVGSTGVMPQLPADLVNPSSLEPLQRVPIFGGSSDLTDFVWETTREAVNQRVPGSPWTYNQMGGFIPGAGTALAVRDMADSFQQGEIPIHQMVDVAAGALRGSGNPTAYLAGVAIGLWNTTIEQAQEADFPSSLGSTVAFMRSDPSEALAGAAEGLLSGVPEIVKNFTWR